MTYGLMLDGDKLDALIVGGGDVAARKAAALLEAGARVRLIATTVGGRCRALDGHPRLSIEERPIVAHDIEGEVADAMLVVAATDSPTLNAKIAAAVRRLHRLVNVVDAPASGNCVTPAIHAVGRLTIAVTAGGVPTAAARIRDEIAERFDERYAIALDSLADLRDRLLGDDARELERRAWREAASALIAGDFCESIESATFTGRIAAWR